MNSKTRTIIHRILRDGATRSKSITPTRGQRLIRASFLKGELAALQDFIRMSGHFAPSRKAKGIVSECLTELACFPGPHTGTKELGLWN